MWDAGSPLPFLNINSYVFMIWVIYGWIVDMEWKVQISSTIQVGTHHSKNLGFFTGSFSVWKVSDSHCSVSVWYPSTLVVEYWFCTNPEEKCIYTPREVLASPILVAEALTKHWSIVSPRGTLNKVPIPAVSEIIGLCDHRGILRFFNNQDQRILTYPRRPNSILYLFFVN